MSETLSEDLAEDISEDLAEEQKRRELTSIWGRRCGTNIDFRAGKLRSSDIAQIARSPSAAQLGDAEQPPSVVQE